MAGIETVTGQCRFLFEKYHYRVVGSTEFANSDNWLVVLASPASGRLLVLEDRGEVIVALAPPSTAPTATAGPWFDLAVVLEYLQCGDDRRARMPGDVNAQLAGWAAALKPCMPQVQELFGTAAFEDAHAELDRIGTRREDELAWQDNELN